MPTYSPSLRVELITTGDQAGTWGNTTNSNFEYIFDSAIAGYQTVSVTTANQAFTYNSGPTSTPALNQSIYAMLRLTTTTVAAFNVYAPPNPKQYIIWNNSGFAATIYNSSVIGNTTAAGTGITVANNDRVVVFSDGTNFYDIKASSITGTLPIANGGTGQITANAAFNALAPVQTSAAGLYLKSDGTNTSWDAIDISTADVTGVLLGVNGGTGVNNSGKTITLGGNLTTSGAFAVTLTATATTNVTLPVSGTLVNQTATETLYNKTLNSPVLTTPDLGVPSAGTLTNCDGLPLTTGVTGTLPVANGGTGVTTSTGTGSVVLNNAPTLTAPQFADQGYIADSVGNRVLNFTTNSASVNYINVSASITANAPTVSAAGANTNISLILAAKGTGKVRTNADLLIGGFVSAGNGTGSFSANTIFGESVLSSNVSGEYITAMGTNAAAGVTTAQYLTAFGNGAGQTITTSNKHSAFGYRALYSMATMADSGDNWNGCTAVGFRALQSNTGNASVSDSVGVGAGALYSSTTGTLNVALGNGALYSATTASSNVAVGWKALFLHNNTDAVGIGYNAAAAMVNNPITAVGSSAAEVCTGSSVTAIGYRALRSSTTGTDITVVGSGAFQNCVSGCNNNTVIGASAANNMTFGLSNTYVGAAVVASTVSTTSNEIAIGASVTGKGSNTAFIGGTSGAYNGKNVTTWETTSDERIKRNIADSSKGLVEINQLRVRNFQYKEEADMPKTEDGAPVVVGLDPNKQVTGFIAQEIQPVFPEAVATHAHDILSVSADPVLYAMVKAIQELTARLEALEAK
jgi:hypothetical protein